MSLLTVISELALNVGIVVPTQVIGSADRGMREAVQFANEACDELARRVDWGQLTQTATLTGDGTNLKHTLPAGFSRLVRGVCVKGAAGVVRPLTRAEWAALEPYEWNPRYFLLEDDGLTLWPYLANGETVTVIYQSENWCDNGTNAYAADSDASVIDEDLLAKGLIVRWRRQKGMPFEQEEAEYEAAIADLARFNDRGRF